MLKDKCQSCQNLISNCNSCQERSQGKIKLQTGGGKSTKYLGCQSCKNEYYLNKESGFCDKCSSKYGGCKGCRSSSSGIFCTSCYQSHVREGSGSSLRCQPCSLYLPGCSFCKDIKTCTKCQSDYNMVVVWCWKKWFP